MSNYILKTLTAVTPLLIVACAVSEPANYMSPQQRELSALATCKEHIISEPSTPDPWPEKARGSNMGEFDAVVVIAYELDGSGIAKNAKIVKSTPAGLFDSTVMSRLDSIRFDPAITGKSCTYVRTYSKKRAL